MPMRGIPIHGYTHENGGEDEIDVADMDLSNISQGIGNIGDGTNYAQFGSVGELNFFGTGRVRNHLRVEPERLRRPVTNPPAEGLVGMFPTLDFDSATEESVYLSDYIPYRKDPTEGIYVEIVWHSATAATGTVVWGVEYRSIEEGEGVDGATTTITSSDDTLGPGTANKCTFASHITTAAITSEDDIGMRIFRKAADSNDTLGEDAMLTGVHLHFISNKLGEAL